MINTNDIYGASLILSSFLTKRYELPEALTHFITLHEFEKFVRYSTYEVSDYDSFTEIMDDICQFNKYTKVAMPADLELWVKANFSHMLGVINGTISEECFDEQSEV